MWKIPHVDKIRQTVEVKRNPTMTLEWNIWVSQWTEGVSVIPKVQISPDHK